MSIETSKRLAQHCRNNGDEPGALMYEARIKIKEGHPKYKGLIKKEEPKEEEKPKEKEK